MTTRKKRSAPHPDGQHARPRGRRTCSADNRVRPIIFAEALLLAAVLACGDDPPPPPPPPAPEAELTETTPEPAPSEGEVAEIAYAYSPIGKRDPFRSLFDQLQREEQTQQLTDLQRYEIDQLRLVAIVSRIATPYAMVEDPGGKGHTLTRGTLIGKNWGRVGQITPECVVVKEEYRDYTGRKVTNRTSMCLPKPDELKLE